MSSYPQAFIDYLIRFHAERDFFECHEVMEEYWKEHPRDPLSRAYVGLIQTAVSLYHQRRGNRAGAQKMLRSAIANLAGEDLKRLGVDAEAFHRVLGERLARLNEPDFLYEDLDIPIADALLLERCLKQCALRGLAWPTPSDLANTYLIHKHTLRDRSPVIAEREKQRQLKQTAKKAKG